MRCVGRVADPPYEAPLAHRDDIVPVVNKNVIRALEYLYDLRVEQARYT